MKKTILKALLTLMLIFTLAACSGAQTAPTSAVSVVQTTTVTAAGVTSDSTAAATTAVPAVSTAAASVTEALAENSAARDVAEDYVWESSDEVSIVLNGNSITVDGDGATADGSSVTITEPGTYRLSGSLTDGQIIVDTTDDKVVRLVLDGVHLSSTTSAPIYIKDADEAVIVLADGTENVVSDATTYVYESADVDEPNAAIFSAADLAITGTGSLTVQGNFNDGIASQDGLLVDSGTIVVTAVDDGIRGKDYLVVKDGDITVDAQGDGLKADNTEDATMGYISIETGVLKITAGGDALQAETDVLIKDGTIALSSGGGSGATVGADASAKGIKATVGINIDGGTLTIDSADDAINSNASLTINGGNFTIASGDDGMHADASLTVNGGDIQITESYEGIESAVITINDGTIRLISSDDGVNVAGGNEGTGMGQGRGQGGGRPGQGQDQDTFTYTGTYYLNINGGYLVVDAGGDGLDANGAIVMTDGVVLVNGPTENMNAAVDYDGGFKMTGGFLVAAGSAGMAQTSGASSGQNSILINYTSRQTVGTLVHIQNSEGEDILTFAPTKDYQSIAFSSPELEQGATYTIFAGGSATGTANDGLYQDGTYTPGTEYETFTVASVVTQIGSRQR